MTDGQKGNKKDLEERIETLEERVDIKVLVQQIKDCKELSESNSKWYRPQGIVTISILALIGTMFTVVGIFGGKNLIKGTVETSIEKKVQPAIDKYKTDLDKRIVTMEKDIKFNFYYSSGMSAYNNDDYSGAISFYTKAIENNSENPYVYTARGAAYSSKNEPEKALKDYKKSIDLLPTHPLPYINMAEIYFRQGKIVEAKEKINKVNKMIQDGKVNEKEIAVIKEEAKRVQKLLE